jgi:hypothetical protein
VTFGGGQGMNRGHCRLLVLKIMSRGSTDNYQGMTNIRKLNLSSSALSLSRRASGRDQTQRLYNYPDVVHTFDCPQRFLLRK